MLHQMDQLQAADAGLQGFRQSIMFESFVELLEALERAGQLNMGSRMVRMPREKAAKGLDRLRPCVALPLVSPPQE